MIGPDGAAALVKELMVHSSLTYVCFLRRLRSASAACCLLRLLNALRESELTLTIRG